jgi:DNA modification methylase
LSWEFRQGDWIERLREMPDESVQCCVTSPPYFGLRNYGVDGQIGGERTPEEYVEHLVAGFAEVRRVLRKDGTL